MVAIEYEDIIGPTLITAISSFQMSTFAYRVGKARRKFKVPPPSTTGDDGFVRIFRAQQNSVECYPVFLAGLWTNSLLVHQVPACILGGIYLIAREKYFVGYSEAVEKRLPGFRVCRTVLVAFGMLNMLGVFNLLLVRITGKSIFNLFKSS